MDAATIDAARRGDRQALARLLSALQDVWYRFCLSLLRDHHRAADATQETGLRFLSQISGFRGESQLQTWSLGIALNVVREIKRRRISAEPSDDQLASTPERGSGDFDGIENRESRQLLRTHLAALPDRQREAVVLRFFEELSVEETAQAMNCATGTVKATVHQALRALRAKMKQLG